MDPVTTSSEEEDDAFTKKEKKKQNKKIYYDALRQTQLEGHVSVQLMRKNSLGDDGEIPFNPRTNKMDKVIDDSITRKQDKARPQANSLIQFDDLIEDEQ